MMSASVNKIGCCGITYDNSGKKNNFILCLYGPCEFRDNVTFYEVHDPTKLKQCKNASNSLEILDEGPEESRPSAVTPWPKLRRTTAK